MNIEEINEPQIQTMRDNLKFLRGQKGWSVRELSRLSKISPAVLKRIAAGKNFGMPCLLALCRFHRIAPHEIFRPIQPEPR
jgi:hypothetical protein